MIAKAKALLLKYREGIAYLFFGGLATLLNIVLAMVFRFLGLPTTVNTVLDNILCILFRLGTLVLDVAVMWLGADLLGPMLIAPERQNLWFLGVKVFSNVLVIVANYVFSKLIIFKKKG